MPYAEVSVPDIPTRGIGVTVSEQGSLRTGTPWRGPSGRVLILEGKNPRESDTFVPLHNALKMAVKKDPKLTKAGVSGYNKPKRTPSHPTKSHVVVAKKGDETKLIRFGQQGAKTAGKPKEGESEEMKKKRESFKARHRKNIKKGKMSAAYWADKEKW